MHGGAHVAHGSGSTYRPHFFATTVIVGAPFYVVPRYYYPAPAYYAPPLPPVYIEQPQYPPQPEPQGYWYFCPAAGAYYPHLQTCPGGWQRVAQQPPPG